MLEAKKSETFEKIFAIYNKNLLKRKFHSVNISGIENFKNLTLPTLIYVNHSSWWDGLIAFQISRFLNLNSFIMMEEKQLKNLQIFRRLGAFSIVRENSREAFQSIEYAAKILHANSRNTLWIFPQGKISPNDLRPFKFYNGLSHIVKKIEKCSVVPLALRYEFLGNFKPEVFIKADKPFIFDKNIGFTKKTITDSFSNRLEKLLDELKFDITNNNVTNFRSIL